MKVMGEATPALPGQASKITPAHAVNGMPRGLFFGARFSHQLALSLNQLEPDATMFGEDMTTQALRSVLIGKGGATPGRRHVML